MDFFLRQKKADNARAQRERAEQYANLLETLVRAFEQIPHDTNELSSVTAMGAYYQAYLRLYRYHHGADNTLGETEITTLATICYESISHSALTTHPTRRLLALKKHLDEHIRDDLLPQPANTTPGTTLPPLACELFAPPLRPRSPPARRRSTHDDVIHSEDDAKDKGYTLPSINRHASSW